MKTEVYKILTWNEWFHKYSPHDRLNSTEVQTICACSFTMSSMVQWLSLKWMYSINASVSKRSILWLIYHYCIKIKQYFKLIRVKVICQVLDTKYIQGQKIAWSSIKSIIRKWKAQDPWHFASIRLFSQIIGPCKMETSERGHLNIKDYAEDVASVSSWDGRGSAYNNRASVSADKMVQ